MNLMAVQLQFLSVWIKVLQFPYYIPTYYYITYTAERPETLMDTLLIVRLSFRMHEAEAESLLGEICFVSGVLL